MPQRWHWLRLRTTCHPTEDLAKVRHALRHCTGLDEESFDAATEETSMESHHGGEVVLLEATLSRAPEVRGALALLPDADRTRLAGEVEPRTDDDGVFHFRLSKQDAFDGDVHVSTGDDCVQARLKPEVHPSSRQGAMDAVAAWFRPTD